MTSESDYDNTIPTPVDAADDTSQPAEPVCGYPVDRTPGNWPGEAAPRKGND